MKVTKFKLQLGFSLIEVMIALVILAVGVLGISKLQGTLIQNSSNANQRVVAASIAQKKIDDLKSFVNLTAASSTVPATWSAGLAASQIAYSHIDDDEGGAPSGSNGLTSGSQTVGNYTYTLNWNVTDYWQGTTVASTPTSTVPASGELADEKLVTVSVAWTDELGNAQSVSLSTVIDAYSPSLTALSGKVAPGGSGPLVAYTPLAAPDVVPVTLDDGTGQKKESSKPVPDTSKKGNSTIVKFQTVTYLDIDNDGDTDKQRQEEFLSLVCKCKDASGGSSNGDTNYIWFGQQEWDAENAELIDIAVSTPVATINNTDVDDGGGDTPAVQCDVCCRDSADVAGTAFKACRLKRIDGIPRLVEPWKMIAFNIIPASYFNSGASALPNNLAGMTSAVQASNIGLYSDYVIARTRAALNTLDINPAASIVPDTSFASFVSGASSVTNFYNTAGASTIFDHREFSTGSANHRQLQVRAVYIDVPPTEIYEGGTFTPTGVSAVPLDRVPFYENNFTNIAGWIPDIEIGSSGTNTGDRSFDANYTDNHDDIDSSCVQTDLPSSSRNYVTNEEFFSAGGTITDCPTASRGDFYPIVVDGVAPADSASTVQARMFTSNDGVIDQLVDTGASTVDDSIQLIINP